MPSCQVSPSANRACGVLRVTRVWAASRATLYRHRRSDQRRRRRRPGSVGPMPDEALVAAIRKLLAAARSTARAIRKVWARLRFAGIRTSSGACSARLMREHDLLAPSRVGQPHGRRPTMVRSARNRSTTCGAPI